MNEENVAKSTDIEVGTTTDNQVALLVKGITENPVLLKFEEVNALGLAASIVNATITLKNKPVENLDTGSQ